MARRGAPVTAPSVRLRAVLLGRAVPFGRPGSLSAIDKRPVAGPVAAGPVGLDGDEVGDPRVHGGPDKAIHHYPFEHYALWRDEIAPPPAALAGPGGFGENLSTLGLTEADLCVGDVWRVGSARLQVAQARQPCWKLNHRFAVPDMAVRVQTTGRTGWYWRVAEPGVLAAGDLLTLEDRPNPAWPLTRVLRIIVDRTLDRAVLEAMANLPQLAESWRRLAQRRLEHAAVEDWDPRLSGRAAAAP